MAKTTISILGCGWLGFPLAQTFILQQYPVYGSTTTLEKMPLLEQAGIKPYHITLEPTTADSSFESESLNALLDCNVLVVNFPPGRRNPDKASQYEAINRQLAHLAQERGVQHVLFVSSSGVFGSVHKGEITEQTQPIPDTPSGVSVLGAEGVWSQVYGKNLTILRLSGLTGPDRPAGRFLAGKENIPKGGAPVNIVHREDAIQAIVEIVRQQTWGAIFHLSADEHPGKSLFYTHMATKQGYPLPHFADTLGTEEKRISNAYIKEKLGLVLAWPDPMEFS